jgi:hypothetical protein
MEDSGSIKCLSRDGQGARQGKTIGAKKWGRGKAVQNNWGREVGKEQDRAITKPAEDPCLHSHQSRRTTILGFRVSDVQVF